MTEALKAVLNFCFTQAGFQKVRARYANPNQLQVALWKNRECPI